MYVKIYNRILDSSIANNRKLRLFFIDLLLCSDADGNVIMTKEAIQQRIRAPMDEVEWGLQELQKPDANSLTPNDDGRRIIPLEGHGYGWKIVNYEIYRDYKNSKELRDATAERVRRYRERHKKKPKNGKTYSRAEDAEREKRFVKAFGDGDDAACDRISSEKLPES